MRVPIILVALAALAVGVNGVARGADGAGDATKGRSVHMANCMACHGKAGAGDGPAARALRPPPRSWVTPEFWNEMTPERIRAAIRAGAPGTAMMGFPQLTEPDVVNLLAYMNSLRPPSP